ncbi:MAG: hypothetical protein COX65_08785 [Elusimicrobia bacterium CG_4_10_14_0_2_um_filter_56_8]|nr:MAG: hypothetical protein COX65_08785 [Elusimicrobia bacterium CG_4_10_14_0_2_um_filter_56_8]
MAKILIIDDDGIVRDALTVFLSRAGHEVSTAADGGNGVQVFKNVLPDLVILDRDLPVLSGSGVFEKIRAVSPRVPVIILTGFTAPEEAEVYIKHGAASFLSKGDGLSNVLTEVERLLGISPKHKAFTGNTGAAPQAADEVKTRGPLILIADDDESIHQVLSRYLTWAGYRVVGAMDGETALRLAREQRPDIVLLDISMPKKNGLEVLRELVEDLPETGFMMITGNEDEEIAKSCLEIGAFDYIPKPMNLENLGKIINARLLTQ